MPTLLNTINDISAKRVPPEKIPPFQRIKDYQGFPSWTTEQYKIAAQTVCGVEEALGIKGLHLLSELEYEAIRLEVSRIDNRTMGFLSKAAKDIDIWVANAGTKLVEPPREGPFSQVSSNVSPDQAVQIRTGSISTSRLYSFLEKIKIKRHCPRS